MQTSLLVVLFPPAHPPLPKLFLDNESFYEMDFKMLHAYIQSVCFVPSPQII